MVAIVNLENNARQQPFCYLLASSRVVKVDKSQVIPEFPKEEIRRLKEELKDQRLRTDAYDEMITAAEQQFRISLIKKS